MNLPQSQINAMLAAGAVITPKPVRFSDAPAPSKTRGHRGESGPKVANSATPIDETSPELFIPSCKHYGLPRPTPEHKFHPDRKWRFDYAWVKQKVALEIDGGAYSQGRHTRGKGFIKDQEKRNEALLMGWKVLHCVPQDVKDESVFALLKRALTKD